MIELVGLTLGLALIDSLNPSTIGAMAILLPLVKKTEHSLAFLFSTYVTYFAGGLMIYFGIDRLLGDLIDRAAESHPTIFNTIEGLLGLAVFALGVGLLLRRRSQRAAQKAEDLTFKSLKPGYIFLFGIGSTLSDLPTGLPLIGFVGEMIHMQASPVLLLLLLSVYVLIYVSPLIVLYVAYRQVRQWADQLGVWLNRMVGYFNHYALPPLVLGCGIWLVADAIIWQFWK